MGSRGIVAQIRFLEMPKEYEYHKRKQAQEEFEEGMKAIFQVLKECISDK